MSSATRMFSRFQITMDYRLFESVSKRNSVRKLLHYVSAAS